MTRALITGVNGQDDSHLAELLLAKGCEVYVVVRGDALEDASDRPVNASLQSDMRLRAGSLDDHLSICRMAAVVHPDDALPLCDNVSPAHREPGWAPTRALGQIQGALGRTKAC